MCSDLTDLMSRFVFDFDGGVWLLPLVFSSSRSFWIRLKNFRPPVSFDSACRFFRSSCFMRSMAV
ncbi:hypothetical protein HanIR_Chr02g0080831 [Helianthus annuus]|nr:hypothetical protein HanIR_Chr02g0080831 [Helianthus annuus]